MGRRGNADLIFLKNFARKLDYALGELKQVKGEWSGYRKFITKEMTNEWIVAPDGLCLYDVPTWISRYLQVGMV